MNGCEMGYGRLLLCERAGIMMALNYVCPKFHRDFVISSFRPRSIHPAFIYHSPSIKLIFDTIIFEIRVCRVLYLLYGKIGSDVVGRGRRDS